MMRSTLAATALVAALLVPAGSAAQAAGPACNLDNTLCVSAVTLSPATVANANDATPTMTVTLSKGSPGCVQQAWYDLPFGGAGAPLQPVAGRPGVFAGPISTVRAGSPAGAYYPVLSYGCGDSVESEVTPAALQAAGLGRLTVTGTADTTPPRVEALTLGASSVDVTRGDVTIPVSTTLADDVAGVEATFDELFLVATPASIPADLARTRAADPVAIRLTRASGTARRGVWSGSFIVPGGSGTAWRLSVFNLQDRVGNVADITPEVLAAKGFPSQVVSRTTAAPPTPTGVRAVSSVGLTGGHSVSFQGPNSPAGQPRATTWLVTSPSTACGPSTQGNPGEASISVGNRSGWTYCTYTVRAANAAGRSTGTVRVSAFM